jgi:hypothetical protein
MPHSGVYRLMMSKNGGKIVAKGTIKPPKTLRIKGVKK